MKKILLSVVGATVMVFSLATRSNATPIHYTFSGQVSEIILNGVAPDELGVLSIGDEVTYKLLIDNERDASRIQFDGDVIESSSQGDYDYFFVDYLYGSLISNETNQYSCTYYSPLYDNSWVEYNYGIIMNPNQPAIASSFTVGTVDSELSFHMDSILGSSISGIHELLSLEQQFTTLNTVRDANGWMIIKSDVFITQTAPVPEPATMLLFSTGIVCLVFTRIKRK